MVGLPWFKMRMGLHGATNILPANDDRPHDYGLGCWCRPVEQDDGIVSHNSMDGREAFESGERLLS